MGTSIKSCILVFTGITSLVFIGCGGGATGLPSTPAVHNEWTWMGGSNSIDQTGNYGTQGTASSSNTPGARVFGCTWTDQAGNFWLFGGFGATPNNGAGDMNDLWEYADGEWTWIGGSNQREQPGAYGTMGVATPGNIPGARWQATCWSDPQGNFWLYGGLGIDSQGTRGLLGDLWRYSKGEWTWMSGSNIAWSAAWSGVAVFGTEGVASPSNTPGARQSASGWADPSGNLWLLGGLGFVSNGGGNLNDLWKYSNGEWTWMAGSDQVDQYGTYGTLGMPAPGNTPGTRFGAATWVDAEGNLWLFGGAGVGTSGDNCGGAVDCVLSDLWEFRPSLNEWTWVGGPNLSNQPGVFGIQGVAAPANLPPPREFAISRADSAGNFWLFSGDDLALAAYNDVWKYSNGEWTWVGGSTQACQTGTYGTLGAPSATNVPGARTDSVGWTDKSGNLWLFGGDVGLCPDSGYLSTAKLNDLWEYQP
jgi:hypothetical protein